MPSLKVSQSKLSGILYASPSKSHTLRAILFASMADGKSIIHRPLQSPDMYAMVEACQQLGATIEFIDESIHITGVAGLPKLPDNVIDAGNSGQVLRFVAAIASLVDGHTIFTGDHSVRFNRPMQPLIDGLNQLGATCISTKNDGRAPIIVKGPIHAGSTVLDGQDSQPVSGLIIAACFLKGETHIKVNNPGEQPWVGLTLDWLDKFNIHYQNDNFEHYIIQGGNSIQGFEYTVPGDFSSIAYPLAAGILTNSNMTIANINMQDPQGDKALVPLLKALGANIEIQDNAIDIKPGSQLQGADIDMNPFIDAVPILAVLACFAKNKTTLYNAAIARKKECDRLAIITQELSKMGAHIEEYEDKLVIHPSTLHAAQTSSHHDHRIIMSLAVAALTMLESNIIEGTDCIEKSYPTFIKDMQALGAKLEEIA